LTSLQEAEESGFVHHFKGKIPKKGGNAKGEAKVEFIKAGTLEESRGRDLW